MRVSFKSMLVSDGQALKMCSREASDVILHQLRSREVRLQARERLEVAPEARFVLLLLLLLLPSDFDWDPHRPSAICLIVIGERRTLERVKVMRFGQWERAKPSPAALMLLQSLRCRMRTLFPGTNSALNDASLILSQASRWRAFNVAPIDEPRDANPASEVL